MSSYSEFASNLSQIIQSGANAQAEAQRQRGQIWGNALSNIGQIVADIPRQRAQQQELQLRAQAQQLETDKLKQQANDLKALDQAYQQPGGRDAIISALPGHLRPMVQKQFDDLDKAHAETQSAKEKLSEAQTNTFGRAATIVREHGYDPLAAQGMISDLKGKYSDDPQTLQGLQQFEQELHANPTKEWVQQKIDPLIMVSEQRKSDIEAGKAKAVETNQAADNARQLASEQETARHNAAMEAISKDDKSTDNQRQAATAAETARHNRAMENRPVASTAAAVGSIDPAERDYWVKQVKNDPTQWNMLANNKPLQQAVQSGLAKTGTDLNKLSAQSRQMSETAKEILPHITMVQAEAKQIEDAGLMGPVAGRFRDFIAGNGAKYFVGTPNARLIGKFETDLGLLMTAVARAHGGARGGGSPAMLEHMKSIMDAQGKDFSTFLGNLDATKEWMSGYAGMVPTGGPPTASKDPLGIR